MIDRVSFSGEDQELEAIAETYNLLHDSLISYRNSIFDNIKNMEMNVPEKFIGYSTTELEEYFTNEIRELGITMCLNLIASIEAKFRKDYLKRAYDRNKDENSAFLRKIYGEKNKYASLEEDILEAWKMLQPSSKALISEYKGVLGFRHWLAHGRYWIAKLGRKYDFFSVYEICYDIKVQIPFI